MNMIPSNTSKLALLIGAAFLMTACSGLKTNTNGGSSTAFIIGGSVTGLNGTGLVLADNGTDTLTVSGTGTVKFTFKTAVSGAYAVTVQTQPTNPDQTCVVTNGSGTATADVSNVQVACSNTYTISGTVTGLTGSGLLEGHPVDQRNRNGTIHIQDGGYRGV